MKWYFLSLVLGLAFLPKVEADGWLIPQPFFELSSFLDDSPPPFLRSSTRRSYYPRYELVDNDDKFQVALDVPGMKIEEIRVSLENGGELVNVSGNRQVSDENYSFSSQFSQSFSLDQSVQVEKLVATLKDGVLVVSAPKDKDKLRDVKKLIPIQNLDAIEAPPERKVNEELESLPNVEARKQDFMGQHDMHTDDAGEKDKKEEDVHGGMKDYVNDIKKKFDVWKASAELR